MAPKSNDFVSKTAHIRPKTDDYNNFYEAFKWCWRLSELIYVWFYENPLKCVLISNSASETQIAMVYYLCGISGLYITLSNSFENFDSIWVHYRFAFANMGAWINERTHLNRSINRYANGYKIRSADLSVRATVRSFRVRWQIAWLRIRVSCASAVKQIHSNKNTCSGICMCENSLT